MKNIVTTKVAIVIAVAVTGAVCIGGTALHLRADAGHSDADTTPSSTPQDFGCTNILVGKDATVDGSTIGTYSCDGAVYAEAKVVPRKKYRPNETIPLYYRPFPYSYEQYLEYKDNKSLVGEMPMPRETYRYVSLQVWFDEQHVGGMNEYGVTIGETTISGREELSNENGIMGAYTNFWTTSLMTQGLARAKTAQEAIEIMGDLAEKYGYWAPMGPESISVTDGEEAWLMEVFGPGPDWHKGSDRPGAVWCAQRVPDGEVAVSANRSRIGRIDWDSDYFKYSSNIRTLAERMGWWEEDEPFVWYEVYGPSKSRGSIMREWRFFDKVAPSLGFEPEQGRFPFSVEPDSLLSVQDVMALHRDTLQGTEYDVTMDDAWLIGDEDEMSPMANPFGPGDLHELVDVSPERFIGTYSSVFSFVSQVRENLPKPIEGCMWLGFGPGSTTTYTPVYSGVTELPYEWTQTDLSQIDLKDSFWRFRLVSSLALRKYQKVIEDIKGVREPAEDRFFAAQPGFENLVSSLYARSGETVAEGLVTDYTGSRMSATSDTYRELVDYMLFEYYFRGSWAVEQELPSIVDSLYTLENRPGKAPRLPPEKPGSSKK